MVIFDGTSRLGEVLAVVLRYVDGWKIVQRLVRLEFLAKSLSGEEVARELIDILSVSFSIHSHQLLVAMRDGASVNSVAMRTLSVIFSNVLDVRCFSHTLDLVGDKFVTPTLSGFTSHWISLFVHSPKTQDLWKRKTGKSMATFSKTRWWSRWEVLSQVMTQFGDIAPFLTENQDIGPSLRPKLLSIVNDPQSLAFLKMELAITIDIGEHFVKAIYNLEGDGPLALKYYEEILKLRSAIQVAHYPNVSAVAHTIAGGNPIAEQQWISYALSCVQNGISYFNSKFGNDSQAPLNAFKAARYFSPSQVKSMNPSAPDIDCLTAIPFLNDPATITSLKQELPTYLARADAVNPSINVLEWWKENHKALPIWSSAASKIVLLQPSSAAAERFFSLLSTSFDIFLFMIGYNR